MLRPAFVFGLGATGLSAVRSLGRRGVPIVGFSYRRDDPGRASRYCRRFVVCPDPAASPDAFMECLLDERRNWQEVPVFIPAEDAYVALAARFEPTLRAHFRMSLPPPETLVRMEDKRFQCRAAAAAGVPIPQTFTPSNMDEVESMENHLRYPAFVKGAFAHLFFRAFSTKGFKVTSAAELREVYRRVFAAGVDVLVQSVIEGPATNLVSACIYCAASGEGKISGEFVMRKIRQAPIGFGVGTMVESSEDSEVLELASRLCRAIDYRRVAEIEFKRDPDDGRPRLIELNPRLWEQASLAIAAGVDFPYLLYRDLNGESLPPLTGYRLGIRWANLFEDLYLFRKSRHELRLTTTDWLRSWLLVRDVAFFAWDDPGPFLLRLLGFVRDSVRARLRRSAGPDRSPA